MTTDEQPRPTLAEAAQCLVDALAACTTNTGYVYLPVIASRLAAVQGALARQSPAALAGEREAPKSYADLTGTYADTTGRFVEDIVVRLRKTDVRHTQVSEDWEEYETVSRVIPAERIKVEAADEIERLRAALASCPTTQAPETTEAAPVLAQHIKEPLDGMPTLDERTGDEAALLQRDGPRQRGNGTPGLGQSPVRVAEGRGGEQAGLNEDAVGGPGDQWRSGLPAHQPPSAIDIIEMLCNGLEWNIENYPDTMNVSDQEALQQARAFLAAPPAPSDLMLRLEGFVSFLCGATTYEGVEFGDKHPEHRGAFWWRTPLRTLEKELFTALSTQAPAEPALRRALQDMLTHFDKPHRSEWLNDEAYQQACEACAQAHSVLGEQMRASMLRAADAAPPIPVEVPGKHYGDLTGTFADQSQTFQPPVAQKSPEGSVSGDASLPTNDTDGLKSGQFLTGVTQPDQLQACVLASAPGDPSAALPVEALAPSDEQMAAHQCPACGYEFVDMVLHDTNVELHRLRKQAAPPAVLAPDAYLKGSGG